jgi:hypothetical protein
MGKNRWQAYSLLEMILITTFLVIFLLAVNPATYIERFSQVLLKMNMLSQAELIKTKVINMGYSDCEVVTALPAQYSYYIEDTIITLEKTGDSLLLGNQYGQSATLMVALDPNSDGFKYRNRFFDETSNVLDIELIEFSFDSTGFPYKIRGSFRCDSNHIVLNEF